MQTLNFYTNPFYLLEISPKDKRTTIISKAEEKAFFLETLEKYQNKKVPFSLPLTIIKSWAIRFNNEYLLEQKIFESFPIELIEVTDSGKGI